MTYLVILDVWPPDGERAHSCFSSHQVCGDWPWQPWDTNAVKKRLHEISKARLRRPAEGLSAWKPLPPGAELMETQVETGRSEKCHQNRSRGGANKIKTQEGDAGRRGALSGRKHGP